MVISGYSDFCSAHGSPTRSFAVPLKKLPALQSATSLTRQLLAFSRKQMLTPKVVT
jgi:hypothetical protein